MLLFEINKSDCSMGRGGGRAALFIALCSKECIEERALRVRVFLAKLLQKHEKKV